MHVPYLEHWHLKQAAFKFIVQEGEIHPFAMYISV